MKRLIFILFAFQFASCGNNEKTLSYPTKQLDLKAFTINVPVDWTHKKAQGIDSFVGYIVGPQVALIFDCSGMGYASDLVDSEKEWLDKNKRIWSQSKSENGFFNKISSPTTAQKKQYHEADYIVELILKDSTILVPLSLPQEIKSHNIVIDTTDNFIVKTISPKKAGKGTTGVYIKDRNSSFNFQLNGQNLSKKHQEQALEAFKTIKFTQ